MVQGPRPARHGRIEAHGELRRICASKAWPEAQRDAAVSVYGAVRDQGPAAVLAPAPTAEEDAATLARATELLRKDPDAYWRDTELQEAQLEALERQETAPPAEPAIDHDAIERKVAQDDVDRFAALLREDPGKYWQSPELQQQQYRDALGRSVREAPAGEQLGAASADPGQAVAPGPADGGAVRI
jgi:hypothetical protein